MVILSSSRRHVVQAWMIFWRRRQAIKAEVPLSEMFGYSTSLRSATQGQKHA
jgi:elongation factor G